MILMSPISKMDLNSRIFHLFNLLTTRMNQNHSWTMSALESRFPHQLFKCGEDDSGRRLRIKFKYFADYCRVQRDDSPIYLFQSALQEETMSASLLDDFVVPDVMPFDLFNLVGMDKKPPYRWFCIGPKRSGTTVHKDPLGTSAWNAVSIIIVFVLFFFLICTLTCRK